MSPDYTHIVKPFLPTALTARVRVDGIDRLLGLEPGEDDYIGSNNSVLFGREPVVNIYRHVADYDRDYADPQLITVNGVPLEPGPEDEFATNWWSRLVLAMMCHEYGRDISRHEVALRVVI